MWYLEDQISFLKKNNQHTKWFRWARSLMESWAKISGWMFSSRQRFTIPRKSCDKRKSDTKATPWFGSIFSSSLSMGGILRFRFFSGEQNHLRMNVAPDQTIIVGLQIFLDHISTNLDDYILYFSLLGMLKYILPNQT